MEYSSEDYDEEIKVEPRPPSNGQTRSALRIRSSVVRRPSKRTVGFERVLEKVPRGVKRVAQEKIWEDFSGRTGSGEHVEVNLPLLLAAHLDRTIVGAPLQS
ncbi:hypothetical protein Tco_0353342 [Tanacetum coccineum]